MTKKSSPFECSYIKGRPLVMAKLRHKGVARYFEFLIDSGADYTLISKSNAMLLGIDLKGLVKDKVELANLSFLNVYKVRLSMSIHDINLKIPVLVADGEVECLMGRNGIFDEFDILFQERKRSVTFTKL